MLRGSLPAGADDPQTAGRCRSTRTGHEVTSAGGRMRFRLALIATTTVLALVAAVPAEAGPPGPTPGAAGSGDPYFPLQGNGGYDVKTYGLDLSYTPAGRRLDGTAAIIATATQN